MAVKDFLGTPANKQGKVEGENAAALTFDTISSPSEYKAMFEGIAASAITKTFGLFIGKTGISNKQEAVKNGFDPVETIIEDITKSGYYHENKPIWIKLVANAVGFTIAYYPDKPPEIVRNELLLKLAENINSVYALAHAIDSHFNDLLERMEDKIFKLNSFLKILL